MFHNGSYGKGNREDRQGSRNGTHPGKGMKAKLSLSERVYHCEECGLVIDRDLNAAINIQVAGSAPETLNARGGSVRQARPKGGTMRHPAKHEPSGGEKPREAWSWPWQRGHADDFALATS